MAAAMSGEDIPGLNPLAVQRVLRSTVMTCNAFRASSHGNARPHTTGENVRCLNCDDPQWKHWLRHAVIGAEHWKSEAEHDLQQTTEAWAKAADERDRKQEQLEALEKDDNRGMAKRGYSREFTPRTDRRIKIEIDRVPPTLADALRAKAKREGVSIRALTLTLWKGWIEDADK